jgi:hypothetical protein
MQRENFHSWTRWNSMKFSLDPKVEFKKSLKLQCQSLVRALTKFCCLNFIQRWRGNYHCTIDLPFDWFRLVCFTNKNKNYQSLYSWFQTSQTWGQQYSYTSPFSIPCFIHLIWHGWKCAKLREYLTKFSWQFSQI